MTSLGTFLAFPTLIKFSSLDWFPQMWHWTWIETASWGGLCGPKQLRNRTRDSKHRKKALVFLTHSFLAPLLTQAYVLGAQSCNSDGSYRIEENSNWSESSLKIRRAVVKVWWWTLETPVAFIFFFIPASLTHLLYLVRKKWWTPLAFWRAEE